MARNGLVEFLYVLGRDHLPLGVVNGIVQNHLADVPDLERVYSDPQLEEWARRTAEAIEEVSRG